VWCPGVVTKQTQPEKMEKTETSPFPTHCSGELMRNNGTTRSALAHVTLQTYKDF
jgi:hypothetical protein